MVAGGGGEGARRRPERALHRARPERRVRACVKQLVKDASTLAPRVGPTYKRHVTDVATAATQLRDSKLDGRYFAEFAVADLDALIASVQNALAHLPAPPSLGVESEDAPIA